MARTFLICLSVLLLCVLLIGSLGSGTAFAKGREALFRGLPDGLDTSSQRKDIAETPAWQRQIESLEEKLAQARQAAQQKDDELDALRTDAEGLQRLRGELAAVGETAQLEPVVDSAWLL